MSNEGFQYALEHQKEIKEKLGEKDIVMDSEQIYTGTGVAQIFRTSADVSQMRLGRRHFKGHEDYKFNSGEGIVADFQRDYAVFVSMTPENMRNLLEGKAIEYHVARHIKEDDAGHIIEINPNEMTHVRGYLHDLVGLMPKKKIAGVTSTAVKIGNSVVPEVCSSNQDDRGDVLIYSLSGMSSVLYNPSTQQTPRPHFHWGSNGWKKPLEVRVRNDQLFFNDSEGVWRLDFQRRGYDPVKV